MESFNAIRVGDKIEKIFIDFSSYESLIESSKFKRIYRIHTAETIAISDKIGFHVGGFCDDYGSGGSFLAAQVAGYPSLPSDLILCLNDDQYNYLPLDEKQLDALYKYLLSITGQEDAIEEVMENDEGWKEEDRYVLTFKVSCDWPEDPEKFHYSGTFAYPFFANKDVEPFFPYFNYLFTVEGIDTIHGLVTLKLKMGEEEKLIDVAFDKPVSIDFDYNNHPENKTSHRVGHAEFNLYKFFYTKEGFPGKLKVHETYDDNDGTKIDNNHYFEKISDDVEDDIRLEDGQIMYIGFTAADDDFIIAFSTDQDPDDEDKINYIYYPIFIGQELKVSSSFYPDGGDKKVSFNFDISYEEPVLDGYILKIDSKFSYRDTYDEAEKEGHDELEIIDKNKIRLQSCFRYVHVANINNELHEATVFIGESDNLEYCQAYEVSLNKEAHFTYRFNGGANDNFHAEYVDIIVRMEKK